MSRNFQKKKNIKTYKKKTYNTYKDKYAANASDVDYRERFQFKDVVLC